MSRSAIADEHRPLVVHVIHRLQIGGLENGLVNLLNGLPEERWRHAVVCLTGHDSVRERIRRPDVRLYALHKPEGKSPGLYVKLWRLFRELRPDIVHTRNLAALEAQLPAALAGVGVRIHGEHGWDIADVQARSRKAVRLRRAVRPFVHQYVALSGHIESYLRERIGVAPERLARICNGVDTTRFQPASAARQGAGPGQWLRQRFGAERPLTVIGAVQRLDPVKDPLNLLRAFALLRQRLAPERAAGLRLVVVGDGPLRGELEAFVEREGLGQDCWLAGSRDDIPSWLAGFDVFALPSLAEGISNTILEAMAAGLPVVATDVGGNGELVEPGLTGALVPAADPEALAEALAAYIDDPARRVHHGQAGRRRVEARFSLHGMLERYHELYSRLLAARRGDESGARAAG